MPHRSPPPHAVRPADDPGFAERLVALTPRLRAFVRRLCLRDADDVVQETLVRAWRSRAAFRADDGSLDAWLMKIAFRTYLDLRNRRAPHALGDQVESLPAAPAAGVEVGDELAAALRGLSPIERDVLLRFHRQRESIEEIAAALAMPAGTVKSHLHRARTKDAARRADA
jgi:RNA polymerase sigma-70 factor (ECF subfamily)